MSNVLITGGAGFIGYHFSKKLSDNNFSTIILDNLDDYYDIHYKLKRLSLSWEGVPITILEAIELKIPILSTDVGGIKEIIGKDSVFESPNNISELIDKKLNSREIIEYNYDNFVDYIKLYGID